MSVPAAMQMGTVEAYKIHDIAISIPPRHAIFSVREENMPETAEKSNRLRRPHDQRVLKSRLALRAGLLRLLETRSLEQITIKEITQEAAVSYPVFFRQFTGKEELLADIATNEVRSLLERTYSTFDPESTSGRQLCLYIDGHKSLWRSLLTTGAAPAMRTEFARISAEIGRAGHRANPWLPVELASAYVASGVFEVLSWWLGQPADYPVENVVKLLDALIIHPLSEPRNIELD